MNFVRFARTRTVRGGGSLVGAAFVVLGLLVAPVASGASGPSISQTKLQIEHLSARLAREVQLSDSLGQKFDGFKQDLIATKGAITRDEGKVRAAEADYSTTHAALVRALVRDYVFGTASQQGVPLLDINITQAEDRQIYEQQVVGNINAIIHKINRERRTLNRELRAEAHQRSTESGELHQIHLVTVENRDNEAKTQELLAQIKGNLTREVVSYEITVAVAAARANNSTGVNDAILAATAVGGQAAANQVIAAVDAATPPTTVAGTPAGTSQGDAAVTYAASQIGVPYVWGGETPGVGFDCSGLTQWAWGKAGVYIPRTAAEQYNAIAHVPLDQLRPGDLLFYYNLDGDNEIDHVVMYVGSGPYGSQTIIEAAHTGTDIGYEQLFTYGLYGAGRP